MAAQQSEFEEREYEGPLYAQLESLTNVWAPGQVFEAHLGFDRSVFLYDPRLWKYFGVSRPPIGVFLNRMDWKLVWRERKPRPMPNFRLNLFLQVKRSRYYEKRPQHLEKHMPERPCWRFDLEKYQQQALKALSAKVGKRAVVSYAAPVFHRASELYAHTTRRTILQHSTFPRAESLKDHSAWYYCEPGSSGVANVEPERIETVGLLEFLTSSESKGIGDLNADPGEQLVTLSRLVNAAADAVPDDNPRKGQYRQLESEIDPLAYDYNSMDESSRAFMRVAAFATAFNLDWYAVG